MNECNQTDEYNAVLRTKMCVRVIAIMALAAAAVLVVSAGVGAAATTWYVDDDGGAGIDYMKIQDAVDAAGDGDTIEVRSGTYYESVDINRRLVLRGVDTGEGKPVVDAEGDRSPIAVMVDGCTVDGFNVTVSDDEWEDAGILVESSNNTIKNNLINFNQDPDGDTTSWDNGADPDDDGIGDTPYVIDANIQDENPLMSWSEGLDRVIFITPAQTDRLVYGTNENISIDCVLQDDMGHNVTVDNVYATIKKPDSYSEQVSLAETTTGNYNGTFGNSSLAGRYSITIHATTVGAVNDTAELSFEVASSFIDGWVVNETEIHCNEIIVLNGDLTIENGGNLTLRNVTLRMDCDYDGQHHIEVKDGGAFYVYDNDNDPATPEDASVITALNPDQGYLFRVNAGSTFQMKNSELHGCGYEYNSL
ncbi:MAG: hypothetical protein U9N43_05755, partial [Euryarchaeota archaeon]|nr:hypothetical protein [Euryarchaeota archaeon]